MISNLYARAYSSRHGAIASAHSKEPPRIVKFSKTWFYASFLSTFNNAKVKLDPIGNAVHEQGDVARRIADGFKASLKHGDTTQRCARSYPDYVYIL